MPTRLPQRLDQAWQQVQATRANYESSLLRADLGEEARFEDALAHWRQVVREGKLLKYLKTQGQVGKSFTLVRNQLVVQFGQEVGALLNGLNAGDIDATYQAAGVGVPAQDVIKLLW